MINLHKKFTNIDLHEIYKMSLEQKQELVTKNLKIIKYICGVLLVYGMFSLLRYIFGPHTQNYVPIYIIYYIGLCVISVLSIILSLIFVNKTKVKPMIRNSALYICFLGMLSVTTITYVYMEQPLNSFVIFACITVSAFFFFSMEPLVFVLLLLPISVIVMIFTTRKYGTVVTSNVILFVILISLCTFYKWKTLIRDFNTKKILQERNLSIENEIKLASFVQHSFYNKDVTNLHGYEIRFYNKPMAGVSGDMYDFYISDNHLRGLSLFDVSGHGIASGLVTMLVRNIIQQEFDKSPDRSLAEIAKTIDYRFRAEKGGIENFMTGIILRVEDNNIEIVNAGHPKPVIYKASRDDLFFFDEDSNYGSTVIGLNNFDPFFNSTKFRLDAGDELILYTDGITEAIDSNRKQFGKQRLMDSIIKAVRLDMDEQIPSIIKDYELYTKNQVPSDDISFVVIKKK